MSDGKYDLDAYQITNVRSAWQVTGNTDLTEGRGRPTVVAICESEFTANRLGRGKYVQGSDCPVTEIPIFQFNGRLRLYGPIELVKMSKEDKVLQAKQEAFDEIAAKAQAAGLSNEQITILAKGRP